MDKITISDPHEIEKFCPITFSAMAFTQKIVEVLGKENFQKPKDMTFTFTVYEENGEIHVANTCLTFDIGRGT